MGCTDFKRRKEACFSLVAHSPKVLEDFGQSQIEVAFHVLAEEPFGLRLARDPGDFGPEVARIVGAKLEPGRGEGLAGIAGSDERNLAAPRAAVEGSKVTPDRSLIQGLVCHPGHESGRCSSFPLDKTNSSVSGLGELQAELEPTDAGAEGNAGETSAGGCGRKVLGM